MKNSARKQEVLGATATSKDYETCQDSNSPLLSQSNKSSFDTSSPSFSEPAERRAQIPDDGIPDKAASPKKGAPSAGEVHKDAGTGKLTMIPSSGKLGVHPKIRDQQQVSLPQSRKSQDVKRGDLSNVGATAVEKPEMLSIPQTNFAIGVLVMFCFNPPFGLLALYFSLRAAAAYRDGDKTSGAWRARTSIVISLLGIMLTMVIISSAVLYIAVNKHYARRGQRRTGSTSLGF